MSEFYADHEPLPDEPDHAEAVIAELDARPAPPRGRRRHSRGHIRLMAERHTSRDRRRRRYHDYPYWSKRRNHGIRLQKGNRP